MEIFHSIWTIVLFVIFIGIVIWAFSSKRKHRFDEAARLPLEEENIVTRVSEEKDNG